MTAADTFRVLVTGSRRFPSEDAVHERLAFVCAEELPNGGVLTVVHGDCSPVIPTDDPLRRPLGADYYAHTWTKLPTGDRRLTVVEEPHPVDWMAGCQPDCAHSIRRNKQGSVYCPMLGLRRNQRMVDLGAGLVLAFPLPGPRSLSRGTWHCVDAARRAGLTVEIVPPVGPRFTAADVEEALW